MMKCQRLVLSCVTACVALASAAAPADAQVQKRQRAAHGLFGGPDPSPNSQQQLDISASLFGAYDDDITAEAGGLASAAAGLGGVYSGLTSGLSYNRRLGRRASFGANAGTSFRYYPDLKGESLAPVGEQVGAGFSIGSEKNSRNHLSIGGNMGFAPYYSLNGLIPIVAAPLDPGEGDLAPQPVDAIIQKRQSVSYGGGIQAERAFSARSSIALNYGISAIDFQGDRRQSTQSAGAYFRHNLTKALGYRVGYQRADGDFGGGVRMSNQIIDAGLDFLKPLSLTRRTSLTFSFGPSMMQQNNSTQYRAVGDLALNHEMGRTWVARANYHRGIGFVAGLNSAVFSDSFGGGVEGLLTDRLDFSAVGSYSTGEFALTGAPNNFDTYQASAQLRAALTQSTAVYVQYVAYRYAFDTNVGLPLGLPAHLVRQGVRAGLSLWLPLIR